MEVLHRPVSCAVGWPGRVRPLPVRCDEADHHLVGAGHHGQPSPPPGIGERRPAGRPAGGGPPPAAAVACRWPPARSAARCVRPGRRRPATRAAAGPARHRTRRSTGATGPPPARTGAAPRVVRVRPPVGQLPEHLARRRPRPAPVGPAAPPGPVRRRSRSPRSACVGRGVGGPLPGQAGDHRGCRRRPPPAATRCHRRTSRSGPGRRGVRPVRRSPRRARSTRGAASSDEHPPIGRPQSATTKNQASPPHAQLAGLNSLPFTGRGEDRRVDERAASPASGHGGGGRAAQQPVRPAPVRGRRGRPPSRPATTGGAVNSGPPPSTAGSPIARCQASAMAMAAIRAPRSEAWATAAGAASVRAVADVVDRARAGLWNRARADAAAIRRVLRAHHRPGYAGPTCPRRGQSTCGHSSLIRVPSPGRGHLRRPPISVSRPWIDSRSPYRWARDGGRVETGAVVDHLDHDAAAAPPQPHDHVGAGACRATLSSAAAVASTSAAVTPRRCRAGGRVAVTVSSGRLAAARAGRRRGPRAAAACPAAGVDRACASPTRVRRSAPPGHATPPTGRRGHPARPW